MTSPAPPPPSDPMLMNRIPIRLRALMSREHPVRRGAVWTFISLVPLMILYGLAAHAVSKPLQPPTIVLLIADDFYYGDLGFMGNPAAHTPTLDGLASSGWLFPNAHAASSASRPAMASILTGLYPHQHEVTYSRHGPGLHSDMPMLTRLLKSKGYVSWLRGNFYEADWKALGFQHGKPKPEKFVRKDDDALKNFLKKRRGYPALIWWAPKLPHAPINPPRRFVDLIDPETITVPDHVPHGEREAWIGRQREVLAMGAWLDEAVAELFALLSRFERMERTLVVFTSDNGDALNLPAKGTPYEGGLRTPLILWSRGIELGKGKSEALVSSVDLLPTLLEWAGVKAPSSLIGQSLWRVAQERAPARHLLTGAMYLEEPDKKGRPLPHRDVYALYARDETWKYIVYVRDLDKRTLAFWRTPQGEFLQPLPWKGKEELFDLSKDPFEQLNLASEPEHQELVESLRREVFQGWRETGGGRLPIDPRDIARLQTLRLGAPGADAPPREKATHDE